MLRSTEITSFLSCTFLLMTLVDIKADPVDKFSIIINTDLTKLVKIEIRMQLNDPFQQTCEPLMRSLGGYLVPAGNLIGHPCHPSKPIRASPGHLTEQMGIIDFCGKVPRLPAGFEPQTPGLQIMRTNGFPAPTVSERCRRCPNLKGLALWRPIGERQDDAQPVYLRDACISRGLGTRPWVR